MLTLDRREKALGDALTNLGVVHSMRQLPVGDVLCEYEDGGVWVAERKQSSDLVRSLSSGRLFDQTARLHEANYNNIFWFVEGSLDGHNIPRESLWSACLNMALRNKSYFIRTLSVYETAFVVKQLITKCQHLPGIPGGVQLPTPMTKRKRDGDKQIVYLRQLMCIPSISEGIAKKIQVRFSTLPALQAALVNIDTFPPIPLNEKSRIGKARLQKMKECLCE